MARFLSLLAVLLSVSLFACTNSHPANQNTGGNVVSSTATATTPASLPNNVDKNASTGLNWDCAVAPNPPAPFIRAVNPTPCGEVPADKEVVLKWAVDWGSQNPANDLTYTVNMTECGHGAPQYYKVPLGKTEQTEMTLQAFPAGNTCNWWVTSQHKDSTPGPSSNQWRFIFR